MARMADEASEVTYAALSSARLAFQGSVRAVERCHATYVEAYASVDACCVTDEEEAEHRAIASRMETDDALTALERSVACVPFRAGDEPD